MPAKVGSVHPRSVGALPGRRPFRERGLVRLHQRVVAVGCADVAETTLPACTQPGMRGAEPPATQHARCTEACAARVQREQALRLRQGPEPVQRSGQRVGGRCRIAERGVAQLGESQSQQARSQRSSSLLGRSVVELRGRAARRTASTASVSPPQSEGWTAAWIVPPRPDPYATMPCGLLPVKNARGAAPRPLDRARAIVRA